jgi:hypothetical protein
LFLKDYFMLGLHKFVILLLMLILPVQGYAVAFSTMHDAADTQLAATMPCHEQTAAHHATSPAHDDANDTTHDADAANHQCCHQVYTAATSSSLPIASHKFSDVSGFVLPLFTLFIPDSPDRPPRG